LPPLDRAVIIQQELEGRNFREIAATLGTSVIAVRVRAVRARAKLRRALENLGAGPKPASRRRGTDSQPEK
jgi:DNA-directed RNA polymerase specialized sigma24 family protein